MFRDLTDWIHKFKEDVRRTMSAEKILVFAFRLWGLVLIILCLTHFARCQDMYADQFPDHEAIKAMPFGGYAHDKTADFRSPIFTKTFIVSHLAFLGSIPFDVEMTQHCIARGTCVEGNGEGHKEGRAGMYANDLIPFAALTVFDILVQRSHPPKAFRWIAYIAPAYGTALHVRGGLRGLRY